MKLILRVYRSSLKMIKVDLHIFHQNVERLSLFQKSVFLFSHVEPFGYDNVPNEGYCQIFGKIWGQFPHLHKNRGTKRRIQSWDIKNYIMPPTVRSILTSRPFAGSEI